MPNILDWKPDERRAVLVFGGFKTGKTAGACTFPRPNVIDFDRGMATIAQPWWQSTFGKRPIEYKTFKEMDKTHLGVVKVPRAFDDACKYFDEWMKADKRDQFDTWVIDSGTTMAEAASAKAIYLLQAGKMTKDALSMTYKGAIDHGLVVLKKQDFGAERSMMEQFVQMVLDTDKNVVLICHEKILENDSGAIEAIVPLLTGQSAERIPLKFDEVYRLKIQKVGLETKRFLQTQPDGVTRCGTRLGVPNGTEWTWDALNKSITPIK